MISQRAVHTRLIVRCRTCGKIVAGSVLWTDFATGLWQEYVCDPDYEIDVTEAETVTLERCQHESEGTK